MMKTENYIPFKSNAENQIWLRLIVICIIVLFEVCSMNEFNSWLIEFSKSQATYVPAFSDFAQKRFFIVIPHIIFELGRINNNYSYYSQQSKSIYLMKRLKDRNEIHRRSLTAPVISIIIVLTISCLLAIYWRHLYLTRIPASLLPKYDNWKLWRIFI